MVWSLRKILRKKTRPRRRRVTSTKKERAEYLLHKEKARALVQARVEFWRASISVTPGRIAIKNQSSRWGSCSTKGNLNFNYRLALIPLELTDYVIVHELCHLIEFNHSPRFWSHVESILPDYALRKKALHELTRVLARGESLETSYVTTLTSPYSKVS
jgi:predicted metal-dependent hydrolase